jgi:ribosomal protein S18 acetylase RimI-like enzyme
MSYQFIHVDKSASDLSYNANKYRELRLKALKESPEAFTSTWAVESSFADDVWVSRLLDPEKETFVCVYNSPNQDPEWVAQVTLRGPLAAADFALPPESGQVVHSEDEKWHMFSLYTSVSHRGKKLGSRLCQRTFQFLSEKRATQGTNVSLRLMVRPDNEISIRMYRGLGFLETGRCTVEEGLRANGEAELIPKGPLGEKYTTRIGIIMAIRLQASHNNGVVDIDA